MLLHTCAASARLNDAPPALPLPNKNSFVRVALKFFFFVVFFGGGCCEKIEKKVQLSW
jgi:hypothetical protein